MGTKLIIKNSSSSGHVPGDSDIDQAELAINLADKKLYSKAKDGTVFEIGGGGTGGGGGGDGGFSGDYNDLTNKPTIPTDNAELANGAGYITAGDVPEVDLAGYATEEWVEGKGYVTAAELPDAFSGDYDDLTNKPSIPAKTSELENDSGFITLSDVPAAPDGGIPEAPKDGNQYARKDGTWAQVEIPEGFSGDYNDLTNQPTIPTDNAQLANGANYITLGEVPAGFSGNYNDLTNKPTIPTDNAELANGAGYITLAEVPPGFSGDYGDLTNTPDIPSKTSDLTNDSGFITAADVPTVDLGPYAKLTDASQSITAKEFVGDGSKLTNLPGASTPDLQAVTDQGNTTDKTIVAGNFQTSGWLSCGYITSNSSFNSDQIDDTRKAFTASANEVENAYIKANGDAWFAGSVTAQEFIGDGSKLTGVGLPDFRTLTPLS